MSRFLPASQTFLCTTDVCTGVTSGDRRQLRLHESERYWTDAAEKTKYFSENGRPINPDGTPLEGEFVQLQYAVFAGQDYYPAKGWLDLVGTWDDPNDAWNSIEATGPIDWVQVVDLHTGQIIHEG